MTEEVWNGIVIGASGGSLAGITVYGITFVHSKILACIEAKRIRTWLSANTTTANPFRSTRAVASWTNLPIERVQYLCSHDDKVKLSTGEKEDMWGLRVNIREATFE